MYLMKLGESNAARRRIPIRMVLDSDGKTAVTGSTLTVTRSENGAAFAASAGSSTELANGYYYHEFATTDIDTLGFLIVRVTGTGGAREYAALVQIVAFDPYDTVRMGLTCLPNVVIGDTAGALPTLGNTVTAANHGVPVNLGSTMNRTAVVALTNTSIASVSGSVQSVVNDVVVAVNGLNNVLVDIQDTSEAALRTYDLDHLINTAVPTTFGALVANNSVIGFLSSISVTTDFDRTSDSLQALRDTLPPAVWSQVTRTITGTTGGALTEASFTGTPGGANYWDSVEKQADDALVARRLHELIAASNGDSPPAVGSFLGDLLELDGSVFRFTANALELAPTGGSNPNLLLQTTIASIISQTVFTLNAGSTTDNAYDLQAIVLESGTQLSVRQVIDSGYVGSSKQVTIDTAPDFTIAAGHSVKIFATAPGTTAPTAGTVAAAVWDRSTSLHLAVGSFGQQLQPLRTGTAQGGAGDSITLDAGASSINDFYAGVVVQLTGGTGANQARKAQASAGFYNGTTKVLKIEPNWSTNPDATSIFTLHPSAVPAAAAVDTVAIADAVWDEDIVGAHTGLNSAGRCLATLDAISDRTNNSNLNALLGVPDSPAVTLVTKTVDDTWDEDVVGAHGSASTSGLLLRALGAGISTRSNNATLNALLGVPDAAGAIVADTIWDEDIVAAHGTSDTAGRALRTLDAISDRANNANLNALLGVPDVAGANIAETIWDEPRSGHTTSGTEGEALNALFTNITLTNILAQVNAALDTAIPATPTADSINQRIKAIDDLTQASGAGDLAAMLVDTNSLNDQPLVELTQADIGAAGFGTPTLRVSQMAMFMALRNQVIVDTVGGFMKISNDNGVVIGKKSIADSAGVYTEGEMVQGP